MTPLRRGLAGRLLAGLLLTGMLGACSPAWWDQEQHRRSHAFIAYWPPPKDDHGLRLAVKDLIDMQGVVTTAGSEYLAKSRAPATRDAPCLAIARERKVRIVGKTNLSEFAVTVSGRNPYFGTPLNRREGQPRLIPGGSSSGSAVAVANGMADVAFGTDSGGSIRMPAACCGIYGLKTTYGLVSTKGVFPLSPQHLDTVGPMAKDVPHLVLGMDLLQRGFAGRYAAAVAAKPAARQIRIGRLYLKTTDPEIDQAIDAAITARGFQIIRLNPGFRAKWAQAETDGKTIALADIWLQDQQFTTQRDVWSTTKLVIEKGKLDYQMGYQGALKRKAAWQHELDQVFTQVDFIAVPTLQILPPKVPFWTSSIVFEWMVFNSQNTVGVNFAGNPALAIPISMPPKGKTAAVTSLQLVGPRLSEAQLLNAGRLLAAANP